MKKEFKSCFASRMDDYVEFRHSFGVRSDTLRVVLYRFDTFVDANDYQASLTLSLVVEFLCKNPDHSDNTKGLNYQIIRHFADYLRMYDTKTEQLPASLFRRNASAPAPYIFTREEIGKLIASSLNVSTRNPIRGQTLHAMLGLTASTGLRNSEACGLERRDVDLERGTLHIRNTKFGKSRRIPLHASTIEVLGNYAILRDEHFGSVECSAFFLSLWKTHFTTHTFYLSFREACELAGICKKHGTGARLHDLRHTFAVHRLADWYKEGVDVQTMLPALATYMGHGHYTDTAWYLTATAELLGLAADAFDTFWKKEMKS